MATVSTQSTSSATERRQFEQAGSRKGVLLAQSPVALTLGGLSGGSVSSVNVHRLRARRLGQWAQAGPVYGGSAGGTKAGNVGLLAVVVASNGNQGVDSGDGNGTEAGAGGSDLNNNAISAVPAISG